MAASRMERITQAIQWGEEIPWADVVLAARRNVPVLKEGARRGGVNHPVEPPGGAGRAPASSHFVASICRHIELDNKSALC